MKKTNRSSEVETRISEYFEKIFEFQKQDDWVLPKTLYTKEKFGISELQHMKAQLNHVKAKLSAFNLAEWSLHTQARDAGGFVISHLKKVAKPELATQAWCKFYEILSTFTILQPCTDGYLRSVHLCEAPGAFVCSLNHYIVLNHPNVIWNWVANTLNPYYDGNLREHMIPDDRLIAYTPSHWLNGADYTGDIQRYYNHTNIKLHVLTQQKVCLVTADGSIDCMSNPGEQEKLVEFLHYCETVTALAILKKGGSFVLKIFTIFEDSTVCLMYLLNCVFDRVSIFKPCTSKGGNSELYVICTNFLGFEVVEQIWEQLVIPYKSGRFNENSSMFTLYDIPSSFREQLIKCCKYFFLDKQIKVIESNIFYFRKNFDESTLKNRIALYYVRKCRLRAIPKYRKIVSNVNIHKRPDLKKCILYNKPKYVKTSLFCLEPEYLLTQLNFIYGKRIETVHNCFGNLEFPQKKLFSLYSLVNNLIALSFNVINLRDFKLLPYYTFQKNFFQALYAAVITAKNLILINIPFHTQFLVSLWAILVSAYDFVYFGPGSMIFYNIKRTSMSSVMEIFVSIEHAYSANKIENDEFPMDLIQVFDPRIFYNDFKLVPQYLNTYINILWQKLKYTT